MAVVAGIGIDDDAGIGMVDGVGMLDGSGMVAGAGMVSAGMVVVAGAVVSVAMSSASLWQAVRAATRARDRISGAFIGFSSVAAGDGAPYAQPVLRPRECRVRDMAEPRQRSAVGKIEALR